LVYLNYLVQDFEAMCRKLKPHSKRVLIDLGASLSFHGSNNQVVELLELYEKFGFDFDHIYAFEYTFTEPQKVYKELLPEKYFKSYHWINVGEKTNHFWLTAILTCIILMLQLQQMLLWFLLLYICYF
jgi:hypothetical protein